MLEIKPHEAMIATCSLGLAAASYSVTELATYSGPSVEFVAPLAGVSWVLSRIHRRRKTAADDAGAEEGAAA